MAKQCFPAEISRATVSGLHSIAAESIGTEDGEERPELLRAALKRADVPPHSAVFLGDTPADVAGGREAGVRVLAVATGRTPAADLRAAGAHIVLKGLSDTDKVLAAIGA
ncbi:hypothetical protein GCM10010304_51810 [Streptomyces roseoviolaceus]